MTPAAPSFTPLPVERIILFTAQMEAMSHFYDTDLVGLSARTTTGTRMDDTTAFNPMAMPANVPATGSTARIRRWSREHRPALGPILARPQGAKNRLQGI